MKTSRVTSLTLALGTGVLIAMAGLASAGPLTPAAGPVGSTMKTLGEVEPRTAINAANTPGDASCTFKITQPGSYYLTGNLTGASGKSGILITAGNVTVDLNGFAVIGVAGSQVGVSASGVSNIAVTNGTVTGWGDVGVLTYQGFGSRLTKLLISQNVGAGVQAGKSSIVDGCEARSNGNGGIWVDNASVVSNCIAHANTSNGIYLGNGSRADHCTSSLNTACGLSSADGAVFTDCTSYLNTQDGIRAAWTCTVTRCVAESNTMNGISVGAQCCVEGNTASANQIAGVYGRSDASRTNVLNNQSNNNATGVKLDGTQNIVRGNTCGGNGAANYTIVAGNRVGTINVMPLSGAINGSAGGASGTVDAASNFSY